MSGMKRVLAAFALLSLFTGHAVADCNGIVNISNLYTPMCYAQRIGTEPQLSPGSVSIRAGINNIVCEGDLVAEKQGEKYVWSLQCPQKEYSVILVTDKVGDSFSGNPRMHFDHPKEQGSKEVARTTFEFNDKGDFLMVRTSEFWGDKTHFEDNLVDCLPSGTNGTYKVLGVIGNLFEEC